MWWYTSRHGSHRTDPAVEQSYVRSGYVCLMDRKNRELYINRTCHGMPMANHGNAMAMPWHAKTPMVGRDIATDDHGLPRVTMAFPWLTVTLSLMTMGCHGRP